MDTQITGAVYAAVMIVVIVGVDLAFFRGRFWERLIVNIGMVLVFGALYLRFFGRSRSPICRGICALIPEKILSLSATVDGSRLFPGRWGISRPTAARHP